MIKIYSIYLSAMLLFSGCAIGSAQFAMDSKKTINYDNNGRIVSIAEEKKVNEPIAKAGLATVAVAISKSPIAAAIVAGAQSIGDGIGSVVKRSGDTVNDVIMAPMPNQERYLRPSVVGTPVPIPVTNSNN